MPITDESDVLRNKERQKTNEILFVKLARFVGEKRLNKQDPRLFLCKAAVSDTVLYQHI